jgi:hypothetical protein
MSTHAVTSFEWNNGGSNVLIAGSWNNWRAVPCEKSGDSWIVQLALKPGRYEYKWIVDGVWMIDTGQNQVNTNDFVNNVIEIEDFRNRRTIRQKN